MVKLFLFIVTLGSVTLFLREPEFIDARNFELKSLGVKTSTVSADLFYYNPNNMGLQLKKAELDVYIDDKFLGHSLLDTLIFIPKKDTFSFPVNMDVEMKNIFPNAFSLLTKTEIDLRIEGTAKVGKGGLFLNIPVRYQGKQRIR
ncbi:MAG TPA: LEA type 2 family protein [Chitinophagaceae bacterium]|nr:LEA type 2 family protein [Chitinophagaceae bacterium]